MKAGVAAAPLLTHKLAHSLIVDLNMLGTLSRIGSEHVKCSNQEQQPGTGKIYANGDRRRVQRQRHQLMQLWARTSQSWLL